MKRLRLQVTLDDGAFAAVERISLLTGISKASVVAGLLRPNVPALEKLADALEEAKRLRDGLAGDAGHVFGAACKYVSSPELVTKCQQQEVNELDREIENRRKQVEAIERELEAQQKRYIKTTAIAPHLPEIAFDDDISGLEPWDIEELEKQFYQMEAQQ